MKTLKQDTSNPLVSVIIPAYNSQDYISRAVSSVLNQTHSETELIVIDDGSTDRTPEIVYDLSKLDNRVKLISQTNQGVCSARNVGMRESKGDFLAFLDSDDLLDPGFLKTLLAQILHSESDIAFCSYRWVFERSKKTRAIVPDITEGEVIQGKDLILRIIEGRINVWTCSALYTRTLITQAGLRFTPGASRGEDKEFIWKAILNARSIAGTRQILSSYFIRAGSLSKKADLTAMHELSFLLRFRKYVKTTTNDRDLLEVLDSRFLPKKYAYMIYFLSKNGFCKSTLTQIAKNHHYRNQLKKVHFGKAKLDEFIAAMGLRIAPRLAISLFRCAGILQKGIHLISRNC